MLGGPMHKDALVSSLTVLVFKIRASLSNTPSRVIFRWKFGQVLKVCKARSISPRSVQLSPMGSELGWVLLADQSESRKFLCPNMERLCAALKSAAKIYMYVQKMYSSVSRLCDNQSLQSHLLRSKNDKEKY